MTQKDDRQRQTPDQSGAPGSEHRYRMRHDWNNLIEDLIEEGRQKGVFDNLPGRGKPLNLSDSPFGSEMRLANQLMKDNQILPAWLASRKQLVSDISDWRGRVSAEWQRHRQAFAVAQARAHRDSVTLSWDDLCRQWAKEVADINRRIGDFNLRRPANRMELFKLILDDELARIGAPRYLR